MTAREHRNWRLYANDYSTIITGRVAAVLHKELNIAELRTRALGVDPELYDQLKSLHESSIDWRNSATGSQVAAVPELAAESTQWMSTSEVAGRLGITDRAVRAAIERKALKATVIGRSYRISREDMEHYKAARAA